MLVEGSSRPSLVNRPLDSINGHSDTPAVDSFSLLLPALRSQRRHAREALAGLTEEQLITAVPPTTWAPVSALHHLALDVERWWFSAILAGEDSARQYFDAHPGGAWSVPPGTDVFALYEAECARSDEVMARFDPEDLALTWPDYLGSCETAEEIVLHVITETATHAGQLDVVREAIDGKKWLVLD